jgi:hypothetical protein
MDVAANRSSSIGTVFLILMFVDYSNKEYLGEGTLFNKASKETRKYNIYKLSSPPLPLDGKVGDIAILFAENCVTGYYCNESLLWIEDTGIRAGEHEGGKLIHFPQKKWQSWVLNGSPAAIQWEKGQTVRQRIRRKKNKKERVSPTPTAVEPDRQTGQLKKLGEGKRFVVKR